MLRAGDIQGYTEMLMAARQIAAKWLVDEAEVLDAEAIVNILFGYEISEKSYVVLNSLFE